MLVQKRGSRLPRLGRRKRNHSSDGQYAEQIELLQGIIFAGMERLGINTNDSDLIAQLMAENSLSDYQPQQGDGLRRHCEWLVAQAMINLTEIVTGELDDSSTVAKLCRSFLYVGMAASVRDLDQNPMCPTCIVKQYSSQNGASGANVRHAGMRDLKAWAIKKYKAKEWRSANHAAQQLMPEIIEHGKAIGAVLMESNAQRTIAEWFRKSV